MEDQVALRELLSSDAPSNCKQKGRVASYFKGGARKAPALVLDIALARSGQRDALLRLRSVVEKEDSLEEEVDDRVALRELFSSDASSYCKQKGRVAPYLKGGSSLPSGDRRPRVIYQVLSPSWAASLVPENLLRPVEEAERAVREHASERYMVPELAASPQKYGEFLASLNAAGMLGWGVTPHRRTNSFLC